MKNQERNARLALRQLIDAACIARGEAQWTNGYRAGAYNRIASDEDNRLYRKEREQFTRCDIVERRMERAITTYARIMRRSKKRSR